jgi:hypothetical protein
MNDFTDLHTPSPEFRAALERDLVGALRRETRFAPYNRLARSARVRTVMLIVVGAVLGVGCGYASAQVRESQARSELLTAAEASLKLASLRVELAQSRLKRVQQLADVGAVTPREVAAAASELRAMEVALAKTNLDMEEMRASATAPREELWAPLVGGRDFVKQRLELEAALAQQRLTESETALQEADGRFRAGAAGAGTIQDAQLRLVEAQRSLQAVAHRLELRRQFIDENLKAEDVSFRQKLLEVESELAIIQAQSRTAEMRAQLSRERYKIGSGTEIELKRAELELLELQFRIQQLSIQLKAFQGIKRSQ